MAGIGLKTLVPAQAKLYNIKKGEQNMHKKIGIYITILALLGQNVSFAAVPPEGWYPPMRAPQEDAYPYYALSETDTPADTLPLTVAQYRDRARIDADNSFVASAISTVSTAILTYLITSGYYSNRFQSNKRPYNTELQDMQRNQKTIQANAKRLAEENKALIAKNLEQAGLIREQKKLLDEIDLMLETERELQGQMNGNTANKSLQQMKPDEIAQLRTQANEQKIVIENLEKSLYDALETLDADRTFHEQELASLTERNKRLAESAAQKEAEAKKLQESINLFKEQANRTEQELKRSWREAYDVERSFSLYRDQASSAIGEAEKWTHRWSQEQMGRYAALYGKTEQEINQVLPQMIQKDFVESGILQAQDARYMEQYIKEAFLETDTKKAIAFLSRGGSRSPTVRTLYKELANSLRRIHPSNLLILGFFVWAGATQTSVAAQTRNQRLMNNPALLLELSDEEAYLLEQDEESKAICAMISDTYHFLSSLSEKELGQLKQQAQDAAAASRTSPDTRALLAR